jgi:hypothetical protein
MLGRLVTLCALIVLLAAVPAVAATTGGRVLYVSGKPFFPLMLINQCAENDIAHAQQLGINLILNESCNGISAQRQLAMISDKSHAVLPIRGDHVKGEDLVGWTYPDEPEDNGWTPESLARSVADPANDGLVSFLTTAAGFSRGPYRDPHVSLDAYAKFAQLADVAGFDLYPLGHCQQDLLPVYTSQQQFNQLAGARPTFQWIETGPIKPTYCGGFQMTAAELKAETWLAIVGGARGIGFFTHTWTPNENAFDVSPTLQKTMHWLTQLITSVRVGLLGNTVLSGSNSGAIKTLARVSSNQIFVFAVNAQRGPIHVQINVPNLRDGALRVYGEGRTVAVHSRHFVDRFQALGTHIYVQTITP